MELLKDIEELLKLSVSDDYSHKIALALFENVKSDIIANADEDGNYSGYDIKLAIGRSLMDKYNLWDTDFDTLEETVNMR